jgi:hypothetical protein
MQSGYIRIFQQDIIKINFTYRWLFKYNLIVDERILLKWISKNM